ncbi:unnamed protein product [Pelagomonas calceolata]|uniref:Uncharacterized protein n=1 Tax=Pelagomonas calceolata TaxID=35677 RepID=A0A8J2SG18_9STRA|nr:unnamed protein product [Pelagomonas calceolata]
METEWLLKKHSPKKRGVLKFIVALCGAAALAAVAVPRASHGGGLRASPTALKASALKSGLVQDVDKSRWLPECLAWWQMWQGFPTSANPDREIQEFVLVSSYDLISMPAGICTITLYCAIENCGADIKPVPGTPTTLMGDFDVNNGDLAQIELAYGVKFNLPDQIAFPRSVKDVVDVVVYARKASIPISVKTSRIAEAGGFPAYERLQRGKLIATATKMLGHRLPPSIIPTVAKFWGHPGEYASRGHDPWNPGPVFY